MDTKNAFAICPVTNEPIDKQKAEDRGLIRKYQGVIYYLCCNGCATTFDQDPSEYTLGNKLKGEL